MAKRGHLDADRLENCDALVPPALGDSRGAQNGGDQGDGCDRIGAQNSAVAKKREKDGTSSRAEQTLPCNLA